MARTASVAVGGYYKTPTHLLPSIAKLVSVSSFSSTQDGFAVVDPCAGEGEAISVLLKAWFSREQLLCNVQVYTCEMEETRAKAVESIRGNQIPWGKMTTAKGDAFRLVLGHTSYGTTRKGATLLFLNPPYDLDPEHGRLEERFLSRFTSHLAEDGVLVFVVPFYALKASASTIATFFTDVSCFRFPSEDFEVFKQVVLVAKRRTLFSPDPALKSLIETWASDPSRIPEMPDGPAISLAPIENPGFSEWRVADVDVEGLMSKLRPWYSTDRGGRLNPIPGIFPDGSAKDALTRVYPVATPPRAAHIAAGIAAGVFNGARISPNNPKSGLPDLLVKGVFDREFVTVDEKTNKDGDKVGEIQIQQPKLVVTVLDLSRQSYHTIRSSTGVTSTDQVRDMTTADLLESYGQGLMRVMLEQCPVLHDPSRPEDRIPLATLARPLYAAQETATMAAVKLLGGVTAPKRARRGRNAFVLGEIGSGKSSVALAVAETIGARRALIMCPPHLLDSWKEQAGAVLPWAKVTVLSDVSDVDAFASDTTKGLVLGVLSREAGKLGHSWGSVRGSCPKCGVEVPQGDLAKSRSTCENEEIVPASKIARRSMHLAARLFRAAPNDPIVAQFARTRHAKRILKLAQEAPNVSAWESYRDSPEIRSLLASLISEDMGEDRLTAVTALLHAIGDDDLTEKFASALFRSTLRDPHSWGWGYTVRFAAAKMMLTAHSSPHLLDGFKQEFESGGLHFDWKSWNEARQALTSNTEVGYTYRDLKPEMWCNLKRGSVEAAIRALAAVAKLGVWRTRPKCGEFLFQAVPEPRRYPLANYIAKRHGTLLDLLILDEGHELSSDSSAQGLSAHRLTGLGIPTLLLTGSVMNGYAESLFTNQWALDPEFRLEFSRSQRQEFVRRYGYLKQLVEDRDRDTGKVVSFGSHTDRVEKSVRSIGNAPGVLPLFVLRYLLRQAVTLHKSDLAVDLPARYEIVERIEPLPEQKRTLDRLQSALIAQIRKDQFGELAGKLWGQMAELPSYLDRSTADTGNEGGSYVVRYPKGLGGVVAEAEGLPVGTLLPKESWMIDKVKSELAEGRRVMIFSWHTNLLPRLARLLESATGEKCSILDAGKVAAGKRQGWIDREIVGKGRRVLLVNPVAVQTGLNNLVWFSTQVWMENPACNPTVYRQATGRVDRIGQKQETRIYFPIYKGTTQEALHKLLLHKVGVSMSTDGLDAQSALEAAGVGENTAVSALAVGRQLYEIVSAYAGSVLRAVA